MTIQVSTTQSGHVALEILDASGVPVSLELNRYEALAVIGSIAQAINALPTDPTIPLHLQRAALKAKHPSFQVGIAPDGDVVPAIKPDPFPSMEFEFEPQGLSKLIADLRKAANVPGHPSNRAN